MASPLVVAADGGVLAALHCRRRSIPSYTSTAMASFTFSLLTPQSSLSLSPASRTLNVISMSHPLPKGKKLAVIGTVKLTLEAGKATPAPPVGPALGSKGINIMKFCKEYNAMTVGKEGYIIPVVVTVFNDKSFTLVLKTPPASVLILKAAGLEKGSKESKNVQVGKISTEQLRSIAMEKLPDLNCSSIDAAMNTISGTALNMGIFIDPPINP